MPDLNIGDTVFQSMDDQEMKVIRVLREKDKDANTYLNKGFKAGDLFCKWQDGARNKESIFHKERLTRL